MLQDDPPSPVPSFCSIDSISHSLSQASSISDFEDLERPMRSTAPSPTRAPSKAPSLSRVSRPDYSEPTTASVEDKTAKPSRQPYTRHQRWYLEKNNDIELLIEDVIFNVPCLVLRRDSTFLNKAIANHSPADGPLPVADVTATDFERLLAIIYPRDFCQHSLKTLSEWTSILHAASLWGLSSLRALAIRELTPLGGPVDKIVLGRRYDVQAWLADAYVALCERPESLTLDEAIKLGMEDVVEVSRVRAEMRPATVMTSNTETHAKIEAFLGVVCDHAGAPDGKAEPYIRAVVDVSMDEPDTSAVADIPSTPSSTTALRPTSGCMEDQEAVMKRASRGQLPNAVPEEISSIDFECSLDVSQPSSDSAYAAHSAEDRASVHHPPLPARKGLALVQLRSIVTPIDKIAYMQEIGLDEGIEDAYLELCLRAYPLSFEEGTRIGMRAFSDVAAAREAIRDRTVVYSKEECVEILEDIFRPWEELTDVGQGASRSPLVSDGESDYESAEGRVFSDSGSEGVAAAVGERQSDRMSDDGSIADTDSEYESDESEVDVYGYSDVGYLEDDIDVYMGTKLRRERKIALNRKHVVEGATWKHSS